MSELTIVLIAVVVVVVIVAVLFFMSLKKVNQYEKGLVERFNAYEKTVEPGLRVIVPFVERLYRVNMREQVIDVPPQEIITEDNVVVTIDAIIYYQVIDARRALYEIEDFELAIVKLAQTTLRNIGRRNELRRCFNFKRKN